MTLTSKTRSNKIFCFIGPSGTGKTTIADKIPLPQVISYRTRTPRKGEIDGVHGHFISKTDFLTLKLQNLLIAKTEYAGHFYGITQGELLELEDKPMIYVIDWEGYVNFKEELDKLEQYDSSQVVSIFIHTPRHDLEARMLKQGRDKAEIQARLDRADRDFAVSNQCDYVVHNTNGELAVAAYEILKIIIQESFS